MRCHTVIEWTSTLSISPPVCGKNFEPLKADHPLAGLDNVTLAAHAAFRTLEASMTLLRRAIDIVKRVQA